MKLKLSIPKLKPTRGTLVAMFVFLLVLAGGVFAFVQFHANPPKPWVIKWHISRYLKKETGRGDFSIDFKFPSKAEMKKSPADAARRLGAALAGHELAKKDFDTLVKEYIELQIAALALQRDADKTEKDLDQKRALLGTLEKRAAEAPTNAAPDNLAVREARAAAVRDQIAALEKDLPAKQQAVTAKEEAIVPILNDLLAWQRIWAAERQFTEVPDTNNLGLAQTALARDMRQKFDAANSYSTMYRLIGQQLWVADRLLTSANPDHHRVAMRIARQAGRDALNHAENGWLASSIYLAYILPKLALAEGRGGPDALMNECADIFRRSDDQGALLDMYQTVLAQATTPQRRDWARVQVAQVHEQAGEFDAALSWLKQVKLTNDFAWAVRRIPWIERRAKQGR